MSDESAPSLAVTQTEPEWPMEFQLPRVILGIGLVGLVCFSAMLVVTCVLPPGDIPPDRIFWFRTLGAVVWGTMWALSIWCVLGYWRERLIVDHDSVTVHGILKTVRIELAELTEVNWWSFGGVKLRTRDVTLNVGLQNYPRDIRLLVTEHIKKQCPSFAEKNWETYLVYGLRMPTTSAEVIPPDEMVIIKRSRWSKLFASAAVLVLALGLLLLRWLDDPVRQIGGALGIIFFLWGLVHFGTPKQGLITRKPTTDDRTRMRCLIGTLIFGMVGAILCGLLRRFGVWIQWAVFGPFMLIGIGLFLWKFIPLTRQDEKRRVEHAQRAMDEWSNRKS